MSVLDLFRLDGSTALVTGCSRGIGLSIATALAQAGADIVGVSSGLGVERSEVGDAVEAAGRRFHAYRCDLGNRDELRAFIATVLANHPVDILVNNAGIIRRQPAAVHSDENWDDVIRVNQTTPFVLARDLGRAMLERGRGKIVFVASLLSYQGGLTVPGYAASKGAIAQLTKALSNEWASRGVCVNAIAPGYIATENTAPLMRDPERSADILRRIPAGRWGQATDLQGAAVFLCSRASDYLHGSMVVVDGGWMGR